MIKKVLGRSDDYTAEASDIGLAAGVWPVSFVYNGTTYERWRTEWNGARDSVLWVEYRDVRRDSLMTVFND